MRYSRILQATVISVLLLCVVGCVTDEANRYYLREKLPAKRAKEVEVLRQKPTRPYTVIADFQAQDASFSYMRKRAAQIGADAVIIVPVGGWYSESEVWAGRDRNSGSYTRLLATAITYEEEAGTEPATQTQAGTEPETEVQPATEPGTQTQPVTEAGTGMQPTTEPAIEAQPATETKTE